MGALIPGFRFFRKYEAGAPANSTMLMKIGRRFNHHAFKQSHIFLNGLYATNWRQGIDQKLRNRLPGFTSCLNMRSYLIEHLHGCINGRPVYYPLLIRHLSFHPIIGLRNKCRHTNLACGSFLYIPLFQYFVKLNWPCSLDSEEQSIFVHLPQSPRTEGEPV